MSTLGPTRTCLLLTLGLSATLPVRAQEATEPPPPGDQAWQAYRVFHRHCADCHGGHRGNPKGGFGHVLDLERMSGDPDLVVPGQPDASEIYLLMIDPEPDFVMPPPDSDVPPVSEADLAVVRDWIEGGALSGTEPGEDPAGTTVPGSQAEAHGAPGFPRMVGHLHPLIVHFPVALILAALGAQVLGLRQAARWCLWIGALGSCAAVGSGWLAAGAQGYRPDTVFAHRWLGVGTSIAALLAAAGMEAARRHGDNRKSTLAVLLLVLAAGLVGLTGHNGGKLVHGDWLEALRSGEMESRP